MDRRYEVFISSTFVDLEEERAKVMRAVLQLDCFPAGMELFPAADASQWKVIQRAIDRCDYYVVLVAGRYGSLGENNLSYTEQEFDYAVKQGIPVLAFVHGDPDSIPVGKTDKNDEARKKLEAFREKVSTGRVRNTWRTPDELATRVTQALVSAFKTNPRPGWIRGPGSSSATQPGPSGAGAPPAPSLPVNRQVREYIQQGSYRFDEVLSDALRAPSELIASIDGQVAPTLENFLPQVERCEQVCADLITISAEVGYFGKPNHVQALLSATEQLAEMNDARGGFTAQLKLRAYPSVLAFHAAGVAGLANQNHTLMRQFHELRLREPTLGRGHALNVLRPSYALEGPFQPPRSDGRTPKTPQSDRVLGAIKPALLQLPMLNDRRADDLFARFEYLNALAAAVAEGVYPYYGRFLWYGGDPFRGGGIGAAIDAELTQQGENWPPFKAGLFGPSLQALKDAKAELDKQVRQFSL